MFDVERLLRASIALLLLLLLLLERLPVVVVVDFGVVDLLLTVEVRPVVEVVAEVLFLRLVLVVTVDLLRFEVELLRDTVLLALELDVLLDVAVRRLDVVVVVRDELSLRLLLCASTILTLPSASAMARHNVKILVLIASRI